MDTEQPVAKTTSLVFDLEYQMRVDIPDHSDYVDLIKASSCWPFPPLKCFRRGRKWVVVEGFTRGRAAITAECEHVPIQPIDESEALLVALAANSEHGHRRTNADKRKAVLRAMSEWPDDSAAAIAAKCKVSHTYVHKLRASLEEGVEEEEVAGIELEESCPNCGLNLWIERDDGSICSGCDHHYGEPAANDELETQEPEPTSNATPEQPATAKRGRGRPKNAVAPEPEQDSPQQDSEQDSPPPASSPVNPVVKPSVQANGVNTRSKQAVDLLARVGAVIREMHSLDIVSPELHDAWVVVKKALNKVKAGR